MNYQSLFFAVLFAFFSNISCAQNTLDLKPYYFPYETLFQAKVYKYVNTNNPNDILYWHLQSKIINNDTILTTTSFDQDFQELESVVEKITSKGTVLQKYTLRIAGKTTSSRLVHKDVFWWRQTVTDKIKWSARYSSQFGEESIRKMREFIQKTKNYSFKRQSHKTINFKDSFRHSIKTDQEVRTTDFHQEAQYSKGIGLVAYQRTFSDGQKRNYELEKIIPSKNWKEMKKNPSSDRQIIKRT